MTETTAGPRLVDGRTPPPGLFRDLRTSSGGLGSREAARRLTVCGSNELSQHRRRSCPGELLAQFTQPPAVLLMVAAVLAWVGVRLERVAVERP